MELACTIGTQGLPDGRVFSRGDRYEVDDDLASTLIAAGYAEPRVQTTATPRPTVVETPVVADIANDAVDSVLSTRRRRTARK